MEGEALEGGTPLLEGGGIQPGGELSVGLRELERCDDLYRLAEPGDGRWLPLADGGGVGIRGASRDDHGPVLGQWGGWECEPVR